MNDVARQESAAPAVVYEDSLAHDVLLDAETCALPLREWGMDDGRIAATTIFVTGETHYLPVHHFREGGINTDRKYTECDTSARSSIIYLYMGSVGMDAIRQNDETSRVRWISGRLLEGLSRCADQVVMGADAIEAEKRRAERATAVRKGWPRAAGAMIGGALTVAGEVAAVRYNLGGSVMLVVGGIGTVATSFIGWSAYNHAKTEALEARNIRDATEGWPIDQRARKRAEEYVASSSPLPVRRSGLSS